MYSFISGLFHSPCFWDSSMLWQVPNFTTLYYWIEFHYMGFPGGSVGKESTCNAGGIGFIPRLGNSSGEGNGNLLQYSCLGNPMDRGTWWATVHRVAKSWLWLNTQAQSSVETGSVQFPSVAQSYLALCDPMDCSTPDLPVHHQLLELTQTHVHWGGDAIQPFHPLFYPSPPTLNLSQHQGPFWWVSSLHQVARILEFQLQHQCFQWIFTTDFL